MNLGPTRARRHDESGVVAILVAMLSLLVLMFAAFAVDLGMQINRKHQLNDTLDAAAQAGAYALPGNTNQARAEALAFAKAHDETEVGALEPNVDFWCVIASKEVGGLYVIEPSQLPSTCWPGPAPYVVGSGYGGTGKLISCGAELCAIPCVAPILNVGVPAISCNTIRVYQGRDVPFAFAPAGGIPLGGTGTLVSVACKGSCGTVAPNPMDVAIVADRTGSMSSSDVDAMEKGILELLEQMTPQQQYVALGTIGRASAGSTPSGEPGASCPSSPGGSTTSGTWVPVPFSDNYLNKPGQRNDGSALVKGVKCLSNQSSTGTALASPMKAAARYLLGLESNNLGALPTRSDAPTKVLILETDGQPNESPATTGSTSLDQPGDVFSHNKDTLPPVITPGGTTTTTTGSVPNVKTTITTRINETYTYVGGTNACNNLSAVAADAKARNVLVITVAYNLAGAACDDSDPGNSNNSPGTTVTDLVVGNTTYKTQTVKYYKRPPVSAPLTSILAGAASAAAGVPSLAESDCSSSAERAAENADGDYFFCAASGSDMGPIFTTALSQVSKGIKLMKLP